MFTGIITHTVDVLDSQQKDGGLEVVFQKPTDWVDLTLGESINTDGVCLTVAAISNENYTCFLMPETLSKTTFGLHIPKAVNLERALTVRDRFGGHFVQGHVDAIGTVANIDNADGKLLRVDFDASYQSLVVNKGSITINGVSLTISEAGQASLTVALIPHTLEHTTLGLLKLKDEVNIEFDVLGKYVANHLKEGKHAAS